MADSNSPYVAVESFRPHWERLTATGRIRPSDHVTADRVMRDNGKQRQCLTIQVVDKVLIEAGEPHTAASLYLVTRSGVPWSKVEDKVRRRLDRLEQRTKVEATTARQAEKDARRGRGGSLAFAA